MRTVYAFTKLPAAALVLEAELGLPLPIELELPGGRLWISREAAGEVSVTGGVEHLGGLLLAAGNPGATGRSI